MGEGYFKKADLEHLSAALLELFDSNLVPELPDHDAWKKRGDRLLACALASLFPKDGHVSCFYYVPQEDKAKAPVPELVAFHGYFSSYQYFIGVFGCKSKDSVMKALSKKSYIDTPILGAYYDSICESSGKQAYVEYQPIVASFLFESLRQKGVTVMF